MPDDAKKDLEWAESEWGEGEWAPEPETAEESSDDD
jgi:hypothetical protein